MYYDKRCVLIVDDEIKMTRAISDFLGANNFHILTAEDGASGEDVYYKNSEDIDLILLDVMMPNVSGYDMLKNIRGNNCLVPVIMLTARGEEYDQVYGFQLGADDYITKPFSPSLLLARIDSVLKRVGKATTDEIRVDTISANLATRTITNSGNQLTLTNREFELLVFFLIHPRQIFSREQLLNNVWGYDFEGDERTVDTHIKQLRTKLADKGKLIKTVHRVGYKLEVAV